MADTWVTNAPVDFTQQEMLTEAPIRNLDDLLNAIVKHPAFYSYVKKGDTWNAHNVINAPVSLLAKYWTLTPDMLMRWEEKAEREAHGRSVTSISFTPNGRFFDLYGEQD